MSVQGTLARVQPASDGPGYGAGTQALGSSDDSLHAASFPSSPMLGSGATLTDTYIRDQFQAVLDGDQTANVDFPSGGVNMDYAAAPDLDQNATIQDEDGISSGKVDTAGQGQGMSAGPFVPTTASPTGGSTLPEDQPGVKPVQGKNGENGKIHSPQDTRYSYDLDTAYAKGRSGIAGIE